MDNNSYVKMSLEEYDILRDKSIKYDELIKQFSDDLAPTLKEIANNFARVFTGSFEEKEEKNKIKKFVIEKANDIEQLIFYEDGYKPGHCFLKGPSQILIVDKINEIIDILNNNYGGK